METQYNALEEERHWKGYNRGQLFAQYDRELLNELIQIKSNDPYVEGIRQGKADYDREQQNLENVKQPEWLQAGRLKKAFSKSAEPPIYEVRDNDKEKER